MRYASPDQTLILLDWDDTLFPTTELFDRWGLRTQPTEPGDRDQLTEDQERDLASWKRGLVAWLTVCRTYSERVSVVTNARRPWVTDCLERFAPELTHLFEGDAAPIKVTYADEALKTSHRNLRPAQWASEEVETADEHIEQLTRAKYAAMKQVVKKFYSQYAGQTWKNILSIGDSRYEHDAAQEVAMTRAGPAREQLRVKSIMLARNPYLNDMVLRHHLWTVLMPALVHYDGDLNLNLQEFGTGDRMRAIAAALGMELPALGRSLNDQSRYPSPERVETWLDDLAITVQAAVEDGLAASDC